MTPRMMPPMPRRVETDPNRPTHPKWLARAEGVVRVLEELEARDASRTELVDRLKRDLGVDLPNARRLERAYQFLRTDFPQVLFEAREFRASWASVLELSRLKEVSAVQANEVADAVFAGRITAPQIAALAKQLVQPAPVPGLFAAARPVHRMGESFQQRIVALVRENPSVLNLGYVDDVDVPPRGVPLMPDVVLTQGGKTIAVEVKMVTPETPVHAIGAHLARLAQLEQRYTHAVLVFPTGAETVAQMATQLQEAWNFRTPRIILL